MEALMFSNLRIGMILVAFLMMLSSYFVQDSRTFTQKGSNFPATTTYKSIKLKFLLANGQEAIVSTRENRAIEISDSGFNCKLTPYITSENIVNFLMVYAKNSRHNKNQMPLYETILQVGTNKTSQTSAKFINKSLPFSIEILDIQTQNHKFEPIICNVSSVSPSNQSTQYIRSEPELPAPFRCCVSCGSIKVCACAVSLPCGSCCAAACCQ
jgi:hypothetical protein